MMIESHNFENSDMVFPEGHLLGNRYVLDTFIGSGGMGSVYLASDTLLEDKRVAIKLLHREFSRDSELTRQFLREVNMMHSVNNPNVVRTYDAGVDDGTFYFTMEYVDGFLLDEYLESAGRDYDLLGRITAQICKGLEAIHAQSIVHRDLKPGNILVSKDGFVKITDFGVARPVSSGNTMHREIMGSLDYIPPEVFQGSEVTPASDFYSLGVILYGIVTGCFPFEADDAMTLVWKHVHEEAESPRVHAPDIPRWLEVLIIRLLSKDPKERPQSAREIIRFVRKEVYNKSGNPLDAPDAPMGQNVNNKASGTNYSVFDTDNFELELDENSSDHGIDFDTPIDGPSSLDSCMYPIIDPETDVELYNSACLQVIFDALPTEAAIRKHEEEWEKKSKLRNEGRENPKTLAKSIQNAKRVDETARLRFAIQASGVIITIAILFGFGFPAYLDVSGRVAEEPEPTKTIEELKAEYLSGKADQPNRKVNKKKDKSSLGLTDSLDSFFAGFERRSGIRPAETGTQASSKLAASGPLANAGRKLTDSSFLSNIKGYTDSLFSPDGEALPRKVSAAPVETAYPRVAPKQVIKLEQLRRSQQFKPEESSFFKEIRSIFKASSDQSSQTAALSNTRPAYKTSSENVRKFRQKLEAKRELQEIRAQQEALALRNEQQRQAREVEQQAELKRVRGSIEKLGKNFQGQLEVKAAWSSLLADDQIDDVVEVAEALKAESSAIAKQLGKLREVEIEYREFLDSVSDGKVSGKEKLVGSLIGEKLTFEREKLQTLTRFVVQSKVNSEEHRAIQTAQALQVLKEKQDEIEISSEAMRTVWDTKAKGVTLDTSELLSRAAQLEKKLQTLEGELGESQEHEVRRSLSAEIIRN